MPKVPGVTAPDEIQPQAPNFHPASGRSFGSTEAEAKGKLAQTFGDSLDSIIKTVGQYHSDTEAHQAIADDTRAMNDYHSELINGKPQEDPINPGQNLQETQVDEDGNIAMDGSGNPILQTAREEPVAPEQRAELFKAKAEELRKDREQRLGYRSYQKYVDTFDPVSEKMRSALQADSIALTHQQTQANMEQGTIDYARTRAGAPDTVKPAIDASFKAMVDEGVRRGSISPQKGYDLRKQYFGEAEKTSVLKVMFSDDQIHGSLNPIGPQHVREMAAKGEINLPPDQVQKFVDQSYYHERQLIALANAQKAGKDRATEEWQKKQEQQTERTLIDMEYGRMPDGSPVVDSGAAMAYLQAKKSNMKPETYDRHMHALLTGDKTPSNEYVKSDLIARLYRTGEDLSDELQANYLKHTLNAKDYGVMLKANAEIAGTMKGNPTANRIMKKMMSFYQGDKGDYDPKRTRMGAASGDEFYQFVRNNPHSTENDLQTQADRIVSRSESQRVYDVLKTGPRPQFLARDVNVLFTQGTPATQLEALKEAGMATEAAHARFLKADPKDRGPKLNDEAYEREKQMLGRFHSLINTIPNPSASSTPKVK